MLTTVLQHDSADVNVRDAAGRTLLHDMCLDYYEDHMARTDLEKLRILLKAGADPRIQDEEGNSPLDYMYIYDNFYGPAQSTLTIQMNDILRKAVEEANERS